MNNEPSSLVPIFRSAIQGRLLATLFAEPDREFTLSALAAAAGTSQATTWREIDRAVIAGLVLTRKAGQALLVHTNQANRFFRPLRELVLGAFGAPAIVAQEFGEIAEVAAILLFGSWVARYQGEPGNAPADIDVMLLGTPNRDEAYAAADRAESALGYPVQVTIRSVAEWANPDPFLTEVRSRPLLALAAYNVDGLEDVDTPRLPPKANR